MVEHESNDDYLHLNKLISNILSNLVSTVHNTITLRCFELDAKEIVPFLRVCKQESVS